MKSHQLQPKPAYDPEKSDLVSGEEFAVKCQVFQPFHYKRNIHKSGKRPVFQSEIEILGSNTLLHLRNMISCSEDFISTDGDVSENPNAQPSPSTLKTESRWICKPTQSQCTVVRRLLQKLLLYWRQKSWVI
ncbi:uncharacterized protein LOC120351768 [Nilaparvata lugens]|uniref:uncharacterized protein LOC120351768 n=1 Tax=Nilaparvata lugens TaxID=108931 RepID=UPI00193DF4CB|nr:uncharacterized protein LOC120351768 [Nilaparvata lugens]